MSKSSIKHSLPSAEHSIRDGVDGKVCRGKHSYGAEHWTPCADYWSNDSYVDGRTDTCRVCYKARRHERIAAETPQKEGQAVALRDARVVVFGDLGTHASVGWHGDVEYFPITPLLALTRFETEYALLEAIRRDPLVGTLPLKARIIRPRGGAGAPAWHLPWSHFNAFCMKFGNEQTKPQQERAQRILEMAFGHTAESNREGAARVDQGDQMRWQENQESHNKTHKLMHEMREEWRGATHYNDRLLVIRGSIYFKRLWPEISIDAVAQLIDIPNAVEMWHRGYRPYTIGRTGKKKAEDRTDQYGGKPRMKSSPPIAEIHVDDPEEAERILKRTRPRDVVPADGCAEVVWAKPGIEDRIRRSWLKHPHMAVADLAVCMRGWEVGEPVRIEQAAWC